MRQAIKFTYDNMVKIKRGLKTSTFRRGFFDAAPGDCIAYYPGNPKTDWYDVAQVEEIVITDVLLFFSVSDVAKKYLNQYGVKTNTELLEIMREYYPDITDSDNVTMITFKRKDK